MVCSHVPSVTPRNVIVLYSHVSILSIVYSRQIDLFAAAFFIPIEYIPVTDALTQNDIVADFAPDVPQHKPAPSYPSILYPILAYVEPDTDFVAVGCILIELVNPLPVGTVES